MENISTTNEAAPATKPERLIYCGPNVPGGALQRYAVYKGGLPVHLDPIFTQCPAIRSLFVPVASLAKTDQAIATKGTPENVLFQQALAFIQKGGV